ncbi:hypothetical protein CC80DRAFT_410999, partial [Byssothecium circinans]
GANFRTENDPQDPWQREIVIERSHSKLIYVSCRCMEIVHGFCGDGEEPATLVVFQFRVEPDGLGRRIKRVEAKVIFSSRNDQDPGPSVEKAYPDGSISVLPTTQREVRTAGVSSKIGGNVLGVEVGGELNSSKSVEKDVTNMVTVRGRVGLGKGRRSRKPNCVTWALSENTSQKGGVPVSVQGAILLKRQDHSEFQAHVELNATADTWTQARASLKSNPKDDPVLFNPAKEPTNKLRTYDENTIKNLDTLCIDTLADITAYTVWKDAIKST